jgi:phosphate transport system protein
MPVILQREIDKLKKRLLALGTVIEERLQLAAKALDERDDRLAKRIQDGDIEIDQMEVDLEEECLKLLALHQPVANDLRFIIAILKINNDLERIGDLAVNIAERAIFLSERKRIDMPFDFPRMSDKVKAMLKESLDALVTMDVSRAYEVWRKDDEVDEINREMYKRVLEAIRTNTQDTDCLIQLLSVSRYLERIADHTTNIAQDVIYLIRGDIVRHNPEQPPSG